MEDTPVEFGSIILHTSPVCGPIWLKRFKDFQKAADRQNIGLGIRSLSLIVKHTINWVNIFTLLKSRVIGRGGEI